MSDDSSSDDVSESSVGTKHPSGTDADHAAVAVSSGATVEVKKAGILKSNSHIVPNKTEMRLNAAAGIVHGEQASGYNVGDLVFVKHLGWPWPARIEDPSNVTSIVTRFEYAVFLYGIHERKVFKLKDVFLYEENVELLGGKSDHFILNVALVEIVNNPDVNLQRIPSHKKKPIQYLRRSRSHTQLNKYLEDNYLQMVTEKRSDGDVTVISDISNTDRQFNSTGLVSSDSTLGYFAIISSVLFMGYITWWLIIMPFLEPAYQNALDSYFPPSSHSLMYPIAAGTVFVSSIVAFFGALMYGPRVHGRPWVVTAVPLVSPVERRQRLQEFISIIEKRRPAILLLVALALAFYTPCIVFTLTVVVFGGVHLLFNFIVYL